MTRSTGVSGLMRPGSPGLLDGVTHGRQIHHTGDAGEILHQYPGRAVIDFLVGAFLFQPAHHGFDVGAGDAVTVFKAEQVFEKDFEGKGELAEITPAFVGDRIDVEIMIGLAVGLQRFCCSGCPGQSVSLHTSWALIGVPRWRIERPPAGTLAQDQYSIATNLGTDDPAL